MQPLTQQESLGLFSVRDELRRPRMGQLLERWAPCGILCWYSCRLHWYNCQRESCGEDFSFLSLISKVTSLMQVALLRPA